MPRILTGKNISFILKDFPNYFGKDAESEKKNVKLNDTRQTKKRRD